MQPTSQVPTFFVCVCVTYPPCHTVYLLKNIHFSCASFLSVGLHFTFFFSASLSFPHLVPAFSHFLGLHQPHTLSPHLPQWDSGNYHGPLLASSQKKTTYSPYFSHDESNRPSLGRALSHCFELTGGVGGDGMGVLLISSASTFYSLRQFWLLLFGCQYKSKR